MPLIVISHNHPIDYQDLLFRELKKEGLPFEVIFTSSTSRERINLPSPSQEAYSNRVGFEGFYEAAPLWGTFHFVWSSLNALAPSVVIISGYSDAAAWSAWSWASLHKIPKILWIDGSRTAPSKRWWKETLKKLFVSRCANGHVYGKSGRDYLIELGMSPAKIATKRAVLDTTFFSPSTRALARPAPKTFLYVGRFAPEKNLDFLLRAMAGVRRDTSKPEFILRLVGYGPLEASLRRLSSDLNLESIVQFSGPAKREELPGIYRAADVLILPSSRESWGLVVLEAMACGVPALVSNRCGCVRDLITPQTGWCFDPSNVDALTRLLIEVAQLPDTTLGSMGERAASVAAEYAVPNCARGVINSVASVLRLAEHEERVQNEG